MTKELIGDVTIGLSVMLSLIILFTLVLPWSFGLCNVMFFKAEKWSCDIKQGHLTQEKDNDGRYSYECLIN